MQATSRRVVRELRLEDLDEAERRDYLDRALEELRTRTGPTIRLRADGPAVRSLASAIMAAERRCRRGEVRP